MCEGIITEYDEILFRFVWFDNPDFEWCVKCVNRLLWGFIVSCVVSIVGRDIHYEM